MTHSLPCVCTTLRKASRAVTRIYDDRLAENGMTTTQFAVLRNLAREGELSLSRLADLLVMERTSLYRTLAPIEQHGWVTIFAAARGRSKHVALTDAGRAALDRAGAAWEATQRAIVEALGEDQWSALEAQLRQLVDISRRKAA